MSSEVSQISNGEPVEERWYTYDPLGNADMVIRKIAGDEDEFGTQWYRGTELYYVKNGHLWMSRSLRWQLEGDEAVNCEPLAAMEYRYHGGRQRYMTRPREPETLQPYDSADGTWYDYDGDSIYGDLALSYDEQLHTLDVFDTTSHEPGLAQYDHNLGELHHLHGNLIGTTECITDDNSLPVHRAVYTAFGELVYEDGTVGTRYGYAGSSGYQAAQVTDPLSELGWLHVGARYYDPSSGRFMRRDPIGIRGGMNTYEYVSSNPADNVDANGLIPWGAHEMGAVYRGWRNAGKCVDEAVALTERWSIETGTIESTAVIVLPLRLGPAIKAGALRAWPYIKNLRVTRPSSGFWHGPHHPFPVIGKQSHFQIQVYINGKRKAGITIRIPYSF